MLLPKLIVFDLDFTIWDCGGTWCDCLSPPFRRDGGHIFDSCLRQIRLYPELKVILDKCDSLEVPMALASRTQEPAWAGELLELFGIGQRFGNKEIYPSSKLRHFEALQARTGIDFSEMLFFDDEERNIIECASIGVECVLVDDGMTDQLFREGLARLA